ncbi:MAG: phosphatase PAP2 family protein, partial [Thermoflexales bacterium]|nr:phosphatase PAP2 family protein [Thermoflexales bacterium]
AFFRAVSFLGEEDFYILFIPLIFWCLHKGIGARFAVLFLTSAYLNSLLKAVFAMPRPYMVDASLYAPLKTPGYGIPSGHTQNAVVTWGYFGTVLRGAWIAVAVLLPVLIGLSRMYLGDHFPQDVIAGALVGLVLLVVFVILEPQLRNWLSARHTLPMRLGLAALLPPALMLAYMDGVVLGTLWGALIGLTLEAERVRFDHRAPLLSQVLKLVLGIGVVLALRFGLRAILPEGDLSDFLRYAVIGLWVTFGAPWAFVQLRLAGRLMAEPVVSPAGTPSGALESR